MKDCTREITKEQFVKATEEHDAKGIWSDAELCGYGVYSPKFYEKNGKYYVDFEIGDSCD